jgi:hypothetical protein
MAAGARPVPVPFTSDEYVLLPDDGRRYEFMQVDLSALASAAAAHREAVADFARLDGNRLLGVAALNDHTAPLGTDGRGGHAPDR